MKHLIDALDEHAINATLPLTVRAAISRAARELERLTEPKPGPQAAKEPPWGWADKREPA